MCIRFKKFPLPIFVTLSFPCVNCAPNPGLNLWSSLVFKDWENCYIVNDSLFFVTPFLIYGLVWYLKMWENVWVIWDIVFWKFCCFAVVNFVNIKNVLLDLRNLKSKYDFHSLRIPWESGLSIVELGVIKKRCLNRFFVCGWLIWISSRFLCFFVVQFWAELTI